MDYYLVNNFILEMQSKDSTKHLVRKYCFLCINPNKNFQFMFADPTDELQRVPLQLTGLNAAGKPIRVNFPGEYPRKLGEKNTDLSLTSSSSDDIDLSEYISSSSSDEELEAQGRSNGNPNVLVSAFDIYLH